MTLGRLSLFLLVLSMFIAIYATESIVTRFFGDQTLAPLLSILGCAALVFVGRPRLILAVIPLFAAETYFLIMDSSKYPLIRTFTMVIGGLLAYWTCRQKRAQINQMEELDVILDKIEIPWVLCDRSGNIQRISRFAANLVEGNSNHLLGISFFSKFGGGPSKGELIKRFLHAADCHQVVESIFLAIPGQAETLLPASLIPIQTPRGGSVLAVVGQASAEKTSHS